MIDAAGNEITRHGPSSFLGELNLLSGQTVFVTAMAARPVRYIAIERDVLRRSLFEDGPLSNLVLATFISRREALQQRGGHWHRDRRSALLRCDGAPDRRRAGEQAAVRVARRGSRRSGGSGAARRPRSPRSCGSRGR